MDQHPCCAVTYILPHLNGRGSSLSSLHLSWAAIQSLGGCLAQPRPPHRICARDTGLTQQTGQRQHYSHNVTEDVKDDCSLRHEAGYGAVCFSVNGIQKPVYDRVQLLACHLLGACACLTVAAVSHTCSPLRLKTTEQPHSKIKINSACLIEKDSPLFVTLDFI